MATFQVEQTLSAFTNGTGSNSISKIPISCTDPSGSFHMLKPGIPYSHFENAASMSLAVLASSSFAIEADPDDITSVQFRIPAKSAGTTHDRVAFYISGSGEIGVGTKDPESSFDIRDVKQDIDPKNAKNDKEALLKLSRDAAEKDIQAEKFRTARTIGGVSFDGTANINLPGVNTAGNQNTTGNAATATSASYAVTSSMTTGNASTAGEARTVVVSSDVGSADHPLTFIDDTTPDGSAEALLAANTITVNPSTGALTLGNLTISFTQGDGKKTFGTITFIANDARGTRRTATINLA